MKLYAVMLLSFKLFSMQMLRFQELLVTEIESAHQVHRIPSYSMPGVARTGAAVSTLQTESEEFQVKTPWHLGPTTLKNGAAKMTWAVPLGVFYNYPYRGYILTNLTISL